MPVRTTVRRPPIPPLREVAGAVLTMTALALLFIVALTATTASLGLIGLLLGGLGLALAVVETHVIGAHRRRR